MECEATEAAVCRGCGDILADADIFRDSWVDRVADGMGVGCWDGSVEIV